MITLFHDYTSPASAIAVTRLQRLVDEGLDVAFDGFEAIGVDVAVPVTVDIIAALDELRAAAAAEGLTLRRPQWLPPTARAHAVGHLADALGLGASWRETVYEAFWHDGCDLSDVDVLTGLAERSGIDSEAARATALDGAAVARVRRRAAAHRRNGVGGVPTLLTQRTLVPGLLPVEDLRALAAL